MFAASASQYQNLQVFIVHPFRFPEKKGSSRDKSNFSGLKEGFGFPKLLFLRKLFPMRVFFIGVCGTAMGNAAVLLAKMGHEVAGSDAGV